MENVIPINCRHRLGTALRPLLVLLLLCIGASGYAADNKVTLDVSNVSLESVLRSIEKQSDYRFFYSKETVNVNECICKSTGRKGEIRARQAASGSRHQLCDQ